MAQQDTRSGTSPPVEPSQAQFSENTRDIPGPMRPSEVTEHARIRRNTACVRCRDAKVRCNASSASGQPCLRCSKLELQCVVDKSHKRTSRRSKLEELAAEVQNIKDAVVAPRPVLDLHQHHQHGHLHFGAPSTAAEPYIPPLPAPSISTNSVSSNAIFNRPRLYSVSSEHAVPPPLTPAGSNVPSTTGHTQHPAEPRALGSRVFSGEDIDYYFEKYFEHFHPYLPIVRVKDPNACYERGQVLFWAIIMTACRRFARDATAFQFLIDSLLPLIWSAISQPPLDLSVINAVLLLATWPFPTIRFLSDPSMIFAGIAMNSSFLMGLHTGRGSHSEFKHATEENDTTDEEATFTWAGCAIISHRVSAYMGCPSASSLFNKTVDQLLDGSSQFPLPRYFFLHLETARFANRVSRTMCASLEEAQGVSHHLVAYMEEEYTKIQKLLYPDNSNLDHFTLLSTLLEIQTYYFMPLPGYSPELLKRNAIKCYTTAESLIHQAASKLHRETAFLHYAPHFVFRTLLSAICVIMRVHLSSYTKGFQADTVDSLIKKAIRALRICSVQEGDLHVRCAGMLESYWEMRKRSNHWCRTGVSVYTHRLGASLTFDCLRRWKRDVEIARDNGRGVIGPGGTKEVENADGNKKVENNVNVERTAEGPRPTTNTDMGMADPFQRFDWSVFMDDFDWSFTNTSTSSSFMGPMGPT
ncbi:hypothetical protein QBC40DRAFT_286955 [Triangularia verruculosa]|uniref:Zn(2)-C6 fungal-type domain-containing protein n=1 Tax=Triangularia verruculosa TaxID=2587418 RepID=A0AAN7AS88_9PEZI|nr:hypothetical protein QBC40DRAFT_286955 [Triangularia verruculosa]